MCMHFIFYQLSLTFISYPWLSNWDLFQITTFSDLAVERHAFLAISPCKRDGYCNGHRLSLAHIHMDCAGRYSRTLCDRTRSDVNGKAAVSLFRKGKLEDFKIDFCWLWPISTVANRYSGLFDHSYWCFLLRIRRPSWRTRESAWWTNSYRRWRSSRCTAGSPVSIRSRNRVDMSRNCNACLEKFSEKRLIEFPHQISQRRSTKPENEKFKRSRAVSICSV